MKSIFKREYIIKVSSYILMLNLIITTTFQKFVVLDSLNLNSVQSMYIWTWANMC